MTAPRKFSRRAFLRASAAAGGGLVITALVSCSDDDGSSSSTSSRLPTPTTPPTPATADTASSSPSTAEPSSSSAQTATSTEPTTEVAATDDFAPSLHVTISLANVVTLTIHRSEMGQGVRTSLAMVLAEELEVDWSAIVVAQADADTRLGSQTTSGSGSMAGSYSILRSAGATARTMLIDAAAQTWGVDASACHAEHGTVVQTGTATSLAYGDLVSTAATLTTPLHAELKDPNAFTLIGTSPPRLDDPRIVTGTAVYGIDVRLPGMSFATVARCPVPGGTVRSFEANAAKAVVGVTDVVQISNGVAVVATNSWAALQGQAALQVTWDNGESVSLDSQAMRATMKRVVDGQFAEETVTGLTLLEAVYETPVLAHAPMEPLNCVADARSDVCEIWTSTQNPQDVQSFVSDAIGVPVIVHVTLLGGGFGRRLEVDFPIEAAEVSKAIGAPVQVVWSRSDDIQHDFYLMPTYHRLRAGWDASSTVMLWKHLMSGPALNGIAYRAGREVLEDGLDIPYRIDNDVSKAIVADIPLPTGPWRAVMQGPNAFANECFLDEVAAALGQDPLALRLQLLFDDDELRAVLELATSKAGWGQPLPAGQFHGLACQNVKGTPTAMVAQVSVTDGTVRVHRVICAIDCGVVVHPDMVAQQIEGGVVYGLTALLKSEITIIGGAVQQANFTDYPLLELAEMPVVEVHAVPSDGPPRGVGEMGVPAVVPAVVNAIHAATGVRIRRIPLHAGDLG